RIGGVRVGQALTVPEVLELILHREIVGAVLLVGEQLGQLALDTAGGDVPAEPLGERTVEPALASEPIQVAERQFVKRQTLGVDQVPGKGVHHQPTTEALPAPLRILLGEWVIEWHPADPVKGQPSVAQTWTPRLTARTLLHGSNLHSR